MYALLCILFALLMYNFSKGIETCKKYKRRPKKSLRSKRQSKLLAKVKRSMKEANAFRFRTPY
jgi:hypothetical protein